MTDTPTTEPTEEIKPLRHEFQIGTDKYFYQFDQLSADRIFDAQTFFRIHEGMKDKMPALPSEVAIAAERRVLLHAMAPLLIKETPHGYEDYDPARGTGIDALKNIRGQFWKLEEIKLDFFVNSGLSSEFSAMESRRLMKEASASLQGLTTDQLQVIMSAMKDNGMLATNKQDANSMSMELINEAIGNLTTGQSSGSPQGTTPSKGGK